MRGPDRETQRKQDEETAEIGGDRRESEEMAEVPREGAEKIPRGLDIQDTVEGA